MENKDVLLLKKDLCSRLPYSVIVSLDNGKYDEDVPLGSAHLAFDPLPKPYLRPLLDMTEGEKSDLNRLFLADVGADRVSIRYHTQYHWEDSECDSRGYCELIDWLNEHHFDHRGLIAKGLALKAPDGMYVTK